MKTLKATIQNAEQGQSLLVLAIAFFALAAFVGIVTDVSILFVRYNMLRRAVDSASVAAATQFRQGTDFGTISLSARQFIEFYGLDPTVVLVNTCDSYADPAADDPELCDAEGFYRKQVRVIAQIESPTVFLRLIGWQSLTLQASAVSETAALDVVVIMDVSESMRAETTYSDWASIGYGLAYMPPRSFEAGQKLISEGNGMGSITYSDNTTSTFTNPFEYWQNGLLSKPQVFINNLLDYNDPNDAFYVKEFQPSFVTGTQQAPRDDCRVRFFPTSIRFLVPPELKAEYAAFGWATKPGNVLSANNWDGFVPTYNFYGCCNDPTTGGYFNDSGNFVGAVSNEPDNNFSDLICQPFKEARDATRQFIDRLDFPQDRVAFVTFDRSAFIIDPYTKPGGTDGAFDHMIFRRQDAINTLNERLGVRAEPNFYVYNIDTDPDNNAPDGEMGSYWNGYAAGLTGEEADCIAYGQQAMYNRYGVCSIPIDYDDDTISADLGSDPKFYNYPVSDNCPYQNAALPTFFSKFVYGPNVNTPVLDNIQIPDPKSAPFAPLNITSAQSYELWASCRHSNMGASLREANRALVDNLRPRASNAVWVIVLLSDGSVGASDPVRRGDQSLPGLSNPYQTPGDSGAGFYGRRTANTYGSLGVCPIGSPGGGASNMDINLSTTRSEAACKNANGSCGTLGELVDTAESPSIFPFCQDEEPSTRHPCDFNAARETNDERSWDVNIDNCHPLYDVDDYARDWADHIGLVDETQQGEITKPTIFTIGFGLKFLNRPGPGEAEEYDWRTMCSLNVPDCLGEQILRYVADVGDNFRIDDDYWQDWHDSSDDLSARYFDGQLLKPGATFGARGPCQDPDKKPAPNGVYGSMEDMYAPLPATVNCGNYFNAPQGDELELVFDEIASRLFTRLSR